jgi:hypothetical protein
MVRLLRTGDIFIIGLNDQQNCGEPRKEKVFMGIASNNSVIMEENMVKAKYLILTACLLFGMLILAVPVSASPAYSISVSPYGSLSSILSPEKLTLIQGYNMGIAPANIYSGISPQKLTAISGAQTTGVSAAQGSVSAFSSYSSRSADSSMEFSQTVSVQGEIYTFDFTASFI